MTPVEETVIALRPPSALSGMVAMETVTRGIRGRGEVGVEIQGVGGASESCVPLVLGIKANVTLSVTYCNHLENTTRAT